MSSLQDCEEINVCGISRPVCGPSTLIRGHSWGDADRKHVARSGTPVRVYILVSHRFHVYKFAGSLTVVGNPQITPWDTSVVAHGPTQSSERCESRVGVEGEQAPP